MLLWPDALADFFVVIRLSRLAPQAQVETMLLDEGEALFTSTRTLHHFFQSKVFRYVQTAQS